jgi:IclR family acetate operon transcriptional repressor
MSAAGRALRVLEYLANAEHPVTSQELSKALDIPRSTLSDLLAELRSLGYVHQVGGRHVPGTALTLLGYRVTRGSGAPGTIERSLAQLAQSTGETAIYCVEIGGSAEQPGQVLIVEQVASPNPIRYVAPTGQPRSMEETASGRVLLAFSARDLDGDRALTKELERVRRQGYAVNVANSGATSIAAPVRDESGRVIAALAVTGPSPRMTDAAKRIWPTLKAAAKALSPG